MEYLLPLAGLAVMHILGAMTPGPNTVVVSYLAAARSRREGLQAAAGVATASVAWVTLSLAGASAVLLEAGWLYRSLRLLGAAYLLFLGIRMLAGALRRRGGDSAAAPAAARSNRSPYAIGVLTTFSNPKSAVFWVSLFIVAVPPHAPPWFYAAIVAIVAVQAAAWYGLVALALSTGPARRVYRRAGRWLDGLAGTVMIALGLRLVAELAREHAR